jgi:hypothetical protein
MMAAGTWIAIVVLGPGALAIFVWFLADLREMLRDKPKR